MILYGRDAQAELVANLLVRQPAAEPFQHLACAAGRGMREIELVSSRITSEPGVHTGLCILQSGGFGGMLSRGFARCRGGSNE